MAAVGGIVWSVASGACYRPAPDARQETPASVARYPHAADRFARLMRRQLSDVDPVLTEQQIICEGERIAITLGDAEASLRIRTALDTAYRTARDSSAFARVERLLGGHSFGTGDHVCDSLIAAADREDPIVPIDSAKP
ncbi:MAG TPA: hypothetical protein VJO52_17425 [Gemmatimonadaceae bacterium]|nr:hypothetical protein [Gemmatimonadaceae bacterium]